MRQMLFVLALVGAVLSGWLPAISATMKPGRSAGRIPAKVSVSDRAMATAGLAKEVEAVNQ